MVTVRPERGGEDEAAAIEGVIRAAFGGDDEAELVRRLRESDDMLAALVAECGGEIVGHILFSRMGIETDSGVVPAVALAPLAVAPAHQRQGIGGRLIEEGHRLLGAQGEALVIVVGHPEYYPRFGYRGELLHGVESPFRREAFMACELRPGVLNDVRGRVVYPGAFGL